MVNMEKDFTAPIMPSITYAHATTSGKRRENEDSHLVFFHNHLASFVIADGAGGHELGKHASSLTVRSLEAEFKSPNISYASFLKIIYKKYNQINDYIFKEGNEKGIIMATTLAMLNISGDKALVSNAGDTNIYLLRNQLLTPLTVVHTVAAELFSQGKITKDEMQSHDRSHILTKAIGADENIQPFVKEIAVKPNDLYIICSDGLHNHITEERLVQIFSKQIHYQKRELEDLCNLCINEALHNGSNDNITMIALQTSMME